MATLDLAGIITRVCTDLKEKFASKSELEAKQDKLVSGTNIKMVNGESLVGSGNLTIADANTIGYYIRSYIATLPASDTGYNDRLWLTSADGTKYVPINTSTSYNSTTSRTLNTRPINPFGNIVYNEGYYTSVGTRPRADYLWYQHYLTIGYSYVITLTSYSPVYLKCTPQSDGSAVMADVVQALPTTKDGYIYIFLGTAYSSTSMELQMHHPVYYHDGTGIRLWRGAESGGSNSWTNISNVSAPGGATNIGAQTDGHLVCVAALEASPNEDGVLVEGLPECIYGAFFDIWLNDGSGDGRLFTFLLDGNALIVADPESYDPSVHTLCVASFTIMYPIA